MFGRRSSKRITTWVALLAVLMMAFAPLVSQALGADRAWQEICGINGAKWIAADTGSPDKPGPKSVAHVLDHCPYCSVHATALGMPSAAAVALATIAHHAMPSAFWSAPATLFPWRASQPRGPPLIG